MILILPFAAPYSPPVVAARSGGSQTTTFNTAQPITLPSHSAGNLLLVFIAMQAAQTTSTSQSGWTKIGEVTNDCTMAVWAGISGVAQTPLTINTSASSATGHTSYTVSNWSGQISDIGFASATGTSTNMNPPNLTPSQGGQEYLWLAAGAGGNGSSSGPTAAPTGFSNLQTRNTGSTLSTHTGMGSAEQMLSASSLDPDAFTSTSAGWVSFTLSVPGFSG